MQHRRKQEKTQERDAGTVKRARGLWLVAACLWLASVASSLGVVYSTFATRQATQELESLRREASTLQVNAGKFLLEKSTLAAYTRVESEAETKLDMEVPSVESLIMVRR